MLNQTVYALNHYNCFKRLRRHTSNNLAITYLTISVIDIFNFNTKRFSYNYQIIELDYVNNK